MRDEREFIPGSDVPGDDHGPGRIPDHLVDRFFDRELTGAEASALFEQLAGSPGTARDMVRTQRALDALRRPVHAPDLSRSILDRVHRHSPLLTRRQVRHVRLGRLASAAALVLVIAGAFVMQRMHPRVAGLGLVPPSPMGELAASVPADATDAINTLRETARAVRVTTVSQTFSPRHHVGPAPDLTMRARLIPDLVFPWRAQSTGPTETTAWIVPCGTPGEGCDWMKLSPTSSMPGPLLLIDAEGAGVGRTLGRVVARPASLDPLGLPREK